MGIEGFAPATCRTLAHLPSAPTAFSGAVALLIAETDDGDRAEARYFLGDPGADHRVDYKVDVFVSLWRLLGEAGHRTGADLDSLSLEIPPQLAAVDRAFGLAAAHGTTGTVAAGPE